MGKVIKFEYQDVKNFSKEFRKQTGKRNVDAMFRKICDVAMENTISVAEERSLVKTGELKSSWREDVKKTKKSGNLYSKMAINKAYNPRAKKAGMTPYYASFIEEGHEKVPWRKDTHAVPMLTGQSGAEENTRRKLQEIVDKEINKLFGGLFS